MSGNLQKGEGGEWVAAYGTPSITRPNPSLLILDPELLNARKVGERAKRGNIIIDIIPGQSDTEDENTPFLENPGDPPPAEIPHEELPRLARDAAAWDAAMALEFRRPFLLRIFAVVFYLIVLSGIIVGSWFIPSLRIDDSAGWIRDFFQNDFFNWSALVLYIAMLVAGFTYVSLLTCGRSNPFHSRQNNYVDFVVLLPTGGLVFILAPIFTIAEKHRADTSTTSLTVEIFGLEKNLAENIGDSFVYNLIFLVVPFIVGLHFTYLTRVEIIKQLGAKIHLRRWKDLSWTQWVIIVTLCLGLCAFMGFHIPLMYFEGVYVMGAYLIIYGIGILLLYLVSLAGMWYETFHFYPYYYLIALILLPWTRFFNPISAAIQGLLSGVFVEGVARWGFEWPFRNTRRERWRQMYMQWLKHGRDASMYDMEDDVLGAEVLGRVF
jgi:hypothetical protein